MKLILVHKGLSLRLALGLGVAVAAAAATEARADPTLLWSTYYGDGPDATGASDVAFDSNSALVNVGATWATGGIAGNSPGNVIHDSTFGGGTLQDGFVTKLDFSGARQWGTYYGGAGLDFFNRVAVDGSNNVIAFGDTTSSNTNNVIATVNDTTFGGFIDGMLVKFNANGSRAWGSYVGGNGVDHGNGVCVGSTGTIYVVGSTTSTDLPTATSSHQEDLVGSTDAFIAKISSSGTPLWFTYYGGTGGSTVAHGCVVDSSHNIYVVGDTSATMGIAKSGWDNTNSGGGDAFLAKFTTNGFLLEATYYGGTEEDAGHAIDLDASGNVYIAGYTESPDTNLDLIDTIGTSLQDERDGFVAKFDTNLDRVWGRYYGGSSSIGSNIDMFWDLEVEGGAVLLSGDTTSEDLISTPDAFWTDFGGTNDAMFVALDASDGDAFFATYIASDDETSFDRAGGVAGTFAHAAVAGVGGDGLATAGAHDSSFSGVGDGFIMLIRMFTI
ncbi:SBBP repeat-containing protein [Nannocystis punicea]|uniref:SBBP repeat-containing protein n=1 Tax=Nannocystis punicea TaxID=2995304 RepID=A0ABY7GWZ0_9BACT|nr:SBBP repeat-containing protein [Nannocystis poenicansa]WAS91329.1 SBBP repeat-containing protein [Nannocystis poenicansa]